MCYSMMARKCLSFVKNKYEFIVAVVICSPTTQFPSPTLCYISPALEKARAMLDKACVTCTPLMDKDDKTREIGFTFLDPNLTRCAVQSSDVAQCPAVAPTEATTALGDAAGLVIPCMDVDAAHKFWKSLGFQTSCYDTRVFRKVICTDGLTIISLIDKSTLPMLPKPALLYLNESTPRLKRLLTEEGKVD